MILPVIYIADSGKKGKGVFAASDIPTTTAIEISPVLVLSEEERGVIEGTLLYNYIFEWGENCKQAALGMGYISMYNHSYSANCEYEMDYELNVMTIRTVKLVKAGEELHINYNASHNDTTPVWFETH
jgi:SET domain-containing protein